MISSEQAEQAMPSAVSSAVSVDRVDFRARGDLGADCGSDSGSASENGVSDRGQLLPRLSERVDIRLGYRCNARCGFCYYKESLTSTRDEPSTEQVKERLRIMRRAGASEVEFTGGEPTIRRDLPELIAAARGLGYRNISMISNGLRLADRGYAEMVVAAGANDVLFSLHGHEDALHDRQTGVPGSFKKILAAIGHIQALGARCRISTTVNGENVERITDIVGLEIDLGAAAIHLAVFSPVAEAGGGDSPSMVDYGSAAAAIKRAIDRHRDRLPSLSVKYIPFCFMCGYEQHVMNLYQQSFDPDDWNYFMSQVVRRGERPLHRAIVHAAGLLGALLLKNPGFALRHGRRGIETLGVTRLVELLRKRRPKACRRCRYDTVCDHVWKDYLAVFGDGAIVPVEGPKVQDPVWCYALARSRQPGSIVAAPVASPIAPGEGRATAFGA